MYTQVIFVEGSKTYGSFELEDKINQTIATQRENGMGLDQIQITFDSDGARGNAILTFHTTSYITFFKVRVLKRERAISISHFFEQINQIIQQEESKDYFFYGSYYSYDIAAKPQAAVLIFQE